MTEAQHLKLVTKRSMQQTHISQASSLVHMKELQSSSLSSQFVTNMLNPTLNVGMESIFETTSQMDVPTPTFVAPLPMTAPTMTPSTIATITTTSQAPILPTTKIIKEQVKEQVKVQVSNILPRIEQTVNEQLEAETILDTYGETVTLKRRRDDDADKDEEPSAGPDRGSKRRIEGKEPESASASTKTATRSASKSTQRSAGKSTQRSRSRQASASESDLAEEPMQTTFQMEEPSHSEFDTELLAEPTYELMKGSCKSLVELEYHLEEVFKATTDQLDLVNPEGQQYPHNLLKPLPLIPNNRGRRVIPFEHFINNDLEYLRGGASSHKYTTYITKMKAANYGHIKRMEDLVPRTMWIAEPIGYDKHAL
nr:hypothetical protein [Tanacetum cinerariifolium]